MAQRTSGLHQMLCSANAYNGFQRLLGASHFYRKYTSQYLKPAANSKVLDIGCGTSEILRFLPESIDYVGYDLSNEYIDSACSKFGNRGRWNCAPVSSMDIEEMGSFDLIMANGLLHHLDDADATTLFNSARDALKPGGRVCTIDACYMTKQSSIARFIISCDRGQNIRKPLEYKQLAEHIFADVKLYTRSDMLYIPYAHSILVCS